MPEIDNEGVVEFRASEMATALEKLDGDPRWTDGTYRDRADLLMHTLRSMA